MMIVRFINFCAIVKKLQISLNFDLNALIVQKFPVFTNAIRRYTLLYKTFNNKKKTKT